MGQGTAGMQFHGIPMLFTDSLHFRTQCKVQVQSVIDVVQFFIRTYLHVPLPAFLLSSMGPCFNQLRNIHALNNFFYSTPKSNSIDALGEAS